tara:strand:+ start:735 stop:947 length:213 start_codon:yes stop_codon:yes gene_type:complete
MEEKKSKALKIILYISVWVIIWGSIASLIDFPLLKNNIYEEGELYQYLTFSITGFISVLAARFYYRKLDL